MLEEPISESQLSQPQRKRRPVKKSVGNPPFKCGLVSLGGNVTSRSAGRFRHPRNTQSSIAGQFTSAPSGCLKSQSIGIDRRPVGHNGCTLGNDVDDTDERENEDDFFFSRSSSALSTFCSKRCTKLAPERKDFNPAGPVHVLDGLVELASKGYL